jgi:hypothetical protein
VSAISVKRVSAIAEMRIQFIAAAQLLALGTLFSDLP